MQTFRKRSLDLIPVGKTFVFPGGREVVVGKYDTYTQELTLIHHRIKFKGKRHFTSPLARSQTAAVASLCHQN